MLRTLALSKIKVGNRLRQDLGDIQGLADSIHEVGLLHPIVIDEKYNLIAGRRRLAAVKLLGWGFVECNVISIDDIAQGEIQENQHRKSFTASEIAAISDYVKSKKKPGKPANGAESAPLPKGKARDIAGDIAGVGHDTVDKIVKIRDAAIANPEYKILLDAADAGEPVNDVYKKLKKLQKRKERHETIKKTQIKLPDTVQLHNTEFQKVKVAPDSVSLVITDPPYLEEFFYLFEDLAKFASEALREGGSLVCYCGHRQIGRVIALMEKYGFTFQWPFAVLHSGPSTMMYVWHVLVKYKPLLWFVKGKYNGEFVRDVIQSDFQGKELHEWAQSTVESDYYIKYMTIEGEIVCDPFLGQGTFGVSAVKQKRQFIGCEINKDHFDTASKLITKASEEIVTA